MDENVLPFYSKLYRCDDCKDLTNVDGVYYFINGKGDPSSPNYLPPTIPVSHFGDIEQAKIWVITTNPKGDRWDPLVGLNVAQFGVTQRHELSIDDVKSIYSRQKNYFHLGRGRWHPYFLSFEKLLDRIPFRGRAISFQSGDVCFVDVIKCPTEKSWQGFVRTNEGKQVWNNCLRIKNQYIQQQLTMYNPEIVLYFGTGRLIKVAYKGRKVRDEMNIVGDMRILTRHLYENNTLTRLSLELSRATLNYPDFQLMQIRKYISHRIIEFYKSI